MAEHHVDERTPLVRASTVPVPEAVTSPGDGQLSASRKRVIVALTLLTGFLSTLDLTIVATSILTISSELEAADQEAWIGESSISAWRADSSDLLGRRMAYLQALVLFTVGTAFCGIAPTFGFLTASRFLAGMGGGGMGTVASVLVADLFPPADRGFYQGLSFAVFGAGMGLGGPIGGALTQAFGWRAAFYAQLPVAAIALILVVLAVPAGAGAPLSWKTLGQVDFGGSLTLLLSIGALLQLLSRSASPVPFLDDTSSLTMAAAFVIFFVAFVYVELRVAAKPVLPLSLLSRRTPLCVGIIAGAIAIVNFNMIYHLPMVFDIVFEQDLAVAGSHLLVNSVAMTVSAPVLGLVVKRTRKYKWATVLCCIGPVIAMGLLATLRQDSSWAVQWLSVIPMGAGFSGLLTLTLVAMLNGVEKSEYAVATGFVFVWRSIGQVFGVALSGAVFQSSLAGQLSSRFDSPDIIDALRHASKAIKLLPPAEQALAREAYAHALRLTFWFGLGGAVCVLITAFVIPNDRLPDDDSN
ncbi:hypothetical protein EHS25_008497 [Saitozyma podzolica]|uniref:Major facilitator superfamily (MFS) profile domain-containing protein n=1 Tax=Saitozyma podzolica TaxID=1890683 RepID=A0A427YLW9_9TREE|nr:hypothetical protein EHS25_008497 [Saitozyma podzolica]